MRSSEQVWLELFCDHSVKKPVVTMAKNITIARDFYEFLSTVDTEVVRSEEFLKKVVGYHAL